jgi:lysyl-tRNA synthetase class 2
MLSSVFRELGCGATLCCQGRIVSLQAPWEMVTVADAFDRHAPLPLSEALRTDCFDEMMACHIEPELGLVKPTFLYDYPLHPGCLAKAKKDAPTLSERFELYIGGLELANAFSELTDAEEQRRRFEAAERERLARGKPVYPVAERFLTALSSLPEAAGIALGIDRLAMILTDRPTIDDVVAFVPEDL